MTSDALFFTQENRMYAAKALVYTSYNANRSKAKQMKKLPVPKTFPTFCIFIFQLFLEYQREYQMTQLSLKPV